VKVALLLNRDNFETYSDWDGVEWELIHMGNGVPNPDEVIATGADVLVVDAVMKIGSDIILSMPGLKLVHSQGVAFNAIDIDAARSAGVYVCNHAGVNAYPVAEHVVLLMLSLLRKFRQFEDMIYSGGQMEAKTSCFKKGLTELGRLKVGIVGCGAIGRVLTSMLKPFGCKICYFDVLGDIGLKDAEYTPLEQLYSSCDIVTLNVPVTPETEGMINSGTLALFKPGAILINTARCELIDPEAVASALKSGILSGFGTDVLAPEPYSMDNPLLNLPEELRYRISISPHVAGITEGTFVREYERIRRNIEAIECGQKLECVVNGL